SPALPPSDGDLSRRGAARSPDSKRQPGCRKQSRAKLRCLSPVRRRSVGGDAVTRGDGRIALEAVSQSFRGSAFRQLGGELTAVDEVSFELTAEPAHIVSLVGESGSGKSTIARIILGLQPPTGGAVTYRGKNVYTLRGDEFRQYRRDVQAVFQDPYGIFNPFYRVDRIFWTVIDKFKLAPSKEKGLALIEDSLRAVDL